MFETRFDGPFDLCWYSVPIEITVKHLKKCRCLFSLVLHASFQSIKFNRDKKIREIKRHFFSYWCSFITRKKVKEKQRRRIKEEQDEEEEKGKVKCRKPTENEGKKIWNRKWRKEANRQISEIVSSFLSEHWAQE